MEMEESWQKALKDTEIIRSRVQSLMTFSETKVSYILLSESSINIGDTVVRKGEILVERPTLYLPPNLPQFSGFDFDEQDESSFNRDNIMNFLLVRGINMPSLKYNNKTYSLDVLERKLSDAIKDYQDMLQQQENVTTGLIRGPEDCWQFSVLIFVCLQIARNANIDIKRLMDDFRKRSG